LAVSVKHFSLLLKSCFWHIRTQTLQDNIDSLFDSLAKLVELFEDGLCEDGGEEVSEDIAHTHGEVDYYYFIHLTTRLLSPQNNSNLKMAVLAAVPPVQSWSVSNKTAVGNSNGTRYYYIIF